MEEYAVPIFRVEVKEGSNLMGYVGLEHKKIYQLESREEEEEKR